MNKILLIIKREFVAKVRNKSFIVMTFLSPLLFVGIGVFVGYLSTMKAEIKTIAIHDETGRFVTEFKSDKEYKYVTFPSKKAGRARKYKSSVFISYFHLPVDL